MCNFICKKKAFSKKDPNVHTTTSKLQARNDLISGFSIRCIYINAPTVVFKLNLHLCCKVAVLDLTRGFLTSFLFLILKNSLYHTAKGICKGNTPQQFLHTYKQNSGQRLLHQHLQPGDLHPNIVNLHR